MKGYKTELNHNLHSQEALDFYETYSSLILLNFYSLNTDELLAIVTKLNRLVGREMPPLRLVKNEAGIQGTIPRLPAMRPPLVLVKGGLADDVNSCFHKLNAIFREQIRAGSDGVPIHDFDKILLGNMDSLAAHIPHLEEAVLRMNNLGEFAPHKGTRQRSLGAGAYKNRGIP